MFTVGEFSKICQVTIKTLHYYDRIGLLQPSKVDKFTGYRYYNQTQLDKMLLIQRLKRYGFSLEEIAQLMECTEAELLLARLRRQQHKLQQQMQSTQLIINELDAHLQSIERTGNIMEYQKNYEIKLTQTPARAVLTCRQNMGVGEFGQYYSSIFERIAKKKLTPNNICGAIYNDREFDPDHSDIELFVGVEEEKQADKLLPGSLCAMTIHKGAYSSLHDAYGALMNWIAESDYECCGAPFDIYTKGSFQMLPPEQWETEVYFPVKKK